MGRQFGLIAVLTLMVLVIEFTPGCHGRTLSSKHHHHHHPSGDYPPQDGNGASGDFYPPPPQDGSGGNGDYYPQDGNGDSGDRHYGQPPQGGSGGSGNHPHPPPQGGSGGSGNYPPPSQDGNDASDDSYPPPSQDDNSGSDDRQYPQPPQGGSGGSGNHHHPSPQGGSGASGANPTSTPDWSDIFGDFLPLLNEEGDDNGNSVDSEDEDAADSAASQLASLRSRLVASLKKELMRNSRQGRPHGNDADAIRQLVIQIAEQIGLVDKDGRIHWEVMLTLKEEQVDEVSRIVSEFINQHFVDEHGNIKWNDIAQALFGDGGVISGDQNPAGTTVAPQSRSLSRLLSLIQMQRS